MKTVNVVFTTETPLLSDFCCITFLSLFLSLQLILLGFGCKRTSNGSHQADSIRLPLLIPIFHCYEHNITSSVYDWPVRPCIYGNLHICYQQIVRPAWLEPSILSRRAHAEKQVITVK